MPAEIKLQDVSFAWDGAPETLVEASRALRTFGVVVLREAVTGRRLRETQELVSGWHGRFLAGEIGNYSLDDETATMRPPVWKDVYEAPRDCQSFRKWNAVDLDVGLLPLVDASPHYDVAYDLVGPDLMVTKTQMIVLPSACVESEYLHTDAGSMADVVEDPEASGVMCSAEIFLSDLPVENMGNFTCVPGSHRKRYPWPPTNVWRSQLVDERQGEAIPQDVRLQVTAAAGDVVLFSHALWHGAAANKSSTARTSLIFSYAKSFVRPYDYLTTPRSVMQAGTERQRLLFGDLGGWAWRPGCFYHLPLEYLHKLCPARALQR